MIKNLAQFNNKVVGIIGHMDVMFMVQKIKKDYKIYFENMHKNKTIFNVLFKSKVWQGEQDLDLAHILSNF